MTRIIAVEDIPDTAQLQAMIAALVYDNVVLRATCDLQQAYIARREAEYEAALDEASRESTQLME